MKKVLLIVLVLVASAAFGVDQIATIKTDVSASYEPYNRIRAEGGNLLFEDSMRDVFGVNVLIGVDLIDGLLFADCSGNVDMVKGFGITVSPIQFEYEINAGLRVGIFEASYRYSRNIPMYGYDGLYRISSAETRITIKASTEFNLF